MNKQNIDTSEIAKFSETASQWWDLHGEFKALHEINPLRLSFIKQQAPLSDKTLIDVGCGGGILSESLSSLGANVTGIDMSQAALNIAKLHLLESNLHIDYQLITAESIAEKCPEHYDVVTCMEMLEHVPDPCSIIESCAKLTKPNGDLFFSTMNRNVKSYLFGILGAEYILKLIPKNTHDFAKFIRPSELTHWARLAGLKLVAMKGIRYNPLTKQYSLTDDTSINYMVHFKKC